MALQLGDTAPDFEVDNTDGKIRFHDWIEETLRVIDSLQLPAHHRVATPVNGRDGYDARCFGCVRLPAWISRTASRRRWATPR